MSGHVDGPRAVSDLNEQAVEAAATLLDDSGLTHPQTGPPAAAVITDLIAAYFDSLAEQGIVLVEQPTKCAINAIADPIGFARLHDPSRARVMQARRDSIASAPGRDRPSQAAVEQPTKPCEKCGGSGRYRDVRYWGTMPGSTSCDDCNGSGTVPVVLVDVQEVAEALRHADYPLAPTTLNAAADFILRRFAPESERG